MFSLVLYKNSKTTGYHERDNIKIEKVLVSFASQLWISPHLQFEAAEIGWTSTNYQRFQINSFLGQFLKRMMPQPVKRENQPPICFLSMFRITQNASKY